MEFLENDVTVQKFDTIVIGGGHAGIESAHANAKMGNKTVLITLNLDTIGMMPCNPNIGGTSKGHLVREIDALGGLMGFIADKTLIQSKLLNTSKGPAVHSLRAQMDKQEYTKQMKFYLENLDNLSLRQGEVKELLTEEDRVVGVKLVDDSIYLAKSVVICGGTYLKSRCLYGDVILHTGPNGLPNSNELEEDLKSKNIPLYRFKTGTPARVDRRTIDFSELSEEYGDEEITPFSFLHDEVKINQVPCHLTYTNAETHKIINENLHRSPMYSGVIEGTGTRYCPSIEDKVVRFNDKERHQVFIEPEGLHTNEMYIQGMSTSLPLDVQIKMYRTIKGLENCEFTRNAYAIEYSCIDATSLKLSLESKIIKGLFFAGQINGSSGYEEAAAQGILAGINSGLYVQDKEPLIIDRSEGYIGVLVDDLVIKGTKEPYRMMTSRAEYRLLLRQDNADLRLTEKGYEVGLIEKARYDRLLVKIDEIQKEIERLETIIVKPNDEINTILSNNNSTPLSTGIKLIELLKRPEVSYKMLEPVDIDRPELNKDVIVQVEISVKYKGYIDRQIKQVESFKKLEEKLLPDDIVYSEVQNIRAEAVQKLEKLRPISIGQASRITGVSPSDISQIMLHLEKQKRRK